MDRSDKKIFGALFFSIFVTVTGVGIVVPLLPVFAHQSGASGFAIGWIFGSFAVSRTLFLPFFGRLSDRIGRKPIIVAGLLAYGVISTLFIAANSIGSLILVRFLQGIASAALMPVVQAYVGDISPAGREGRTMGFFNLSMFSGLSLGPLIGGCIRDRWGLDAAFAAMGVLALAGFLFTLTLLPPTRSEQIIETKRVQVPWNILVFNRNMAGLLVFRFGYTFGIGIIWSFLPILADAEHHLSGVTIGVIILLGVLLSGITQVPLGALADRSDYRHMIGVGGGVASLALAAMGWVESLNGLAIASILFGIGGGIGMAAHMALAVQVGSRSHAMGAVMAILTVAHSVGMAAGAVISGLLMDTFGLRTVFPSGAGIMLGSTVVFLLGCSRRTLAADESN